MAQQPREFSIALDTIVEHIDIPKSLYERAAARHRSLGEHLKREESSIRQFDPEIRPQGSFRFGTVIRPLHSDDEYDLDNVCLLKTLGKTDLTQQQVKVLYGEEIKGYARAHDMLSPVTEHHRCWRLQYADDVAFHLDSLPCVPEEAAMITRLLRAGVDEELARRAVAITDRRHPKYAEITTAWLSSNPRGFATWFEQRAALGRSLGLRSKGLRATVEDVPPYEWKTTLQRSIQILKRHRDVMFRNAAELAPISMIITNLSACSYAGEADIAEALLNIVDKMPQFVRSDRPKVPNPADPAEDYADKWSKDDRLEKSFWEWHSAVKRDLARLPQLLRSSNVRREFQTLFDITLTEQDLRALGAVGAPAASPVARAAPALVIPSGPKPWGRNV
jgi:hypothetical protein